MVSSSETDIQQQTVAQVHDLIEDMKTMEFGELHMRHDPKTGLVAIIALHSLVLGPAIGGCRCVEYASGNEAVIDAMRLAQGMSYKAAISNLPHGGGKAVIIKPRNIKDRIAFFSEFARFVDHLGGRYITAEDSGTSMADMEIINRQTPYVTGVPSEGFEEGDPSPLTALGVRHGIEASVKFKLKKDNLQGIKIAIQGLGNVGYSLAKQCAELGASLWITDSDLYKIEKCVAELKTKGANVNMVDKEEIYSQDCDVFAPCALGSVVNEKTIEQIKMPIIAGAANNQLKDISFGKKLLDKGILFAPDYAINAGGLIHVAAQVAKTSEAKARKKIEAIYDTMIEIFQQSEQTNTPTNIVADNIAHDRVQAARDGGKLA